MVDVGDIGVGGGASGQSETAATVSSSEEEASSSQESGAVEAGTLRSLREEEIVRVEREESRSCRLRSATLMVVVGRVAGSAGRMLFL